MEKPVIIISGTSGVGKTTIAKDLVHTLDIDHRLGTGFVREILRSVFEKGFLPAIETFTFKDSDGSGEIIDQFVKQTKILRHAILKCIRRAKNEGTSLIIEGNHLIPGLIDKKEVDLFVLLKVSNTQMHNNIVRGNTHTLRKIDKNDFENILKIQDYLINEATHSGIPVIENIERKQTVKEIIDLLKNHE